MDAAQATLSVQVLRVRRFTLAAMSDFPAEWLALVPVLILDVLWAIKIGFTLTVEWKDLLTLAAALAVGLLLRVAGRWQKISLGAEYFVLTIVSASLFAVLSYLCSALAFPQIDGLLARLDHAIGFHWSDWFRLARDHPRAMTVLRLAYGTLFFQGIYFTIMYAMQGDRARLREIFWIIFVACSVTSLVAALLPAVAHLQAFGPRELGYLDDINRLRAGANLHFNMTRVTGIITFPSFHTTMAVIYTYAFRRTGLITWMMAGFNLVMLVSIPIVGGHYLVDMIAGAAVAGFAIVVVRATPALTRKFRDGRFASAAAGPA